MATAKKSTYIEAELEWAELKLQEWKKYIDSNPIANLKDRIEWKPTAKGGTMPMVIASIESQIKCIRDTTKEMFALMDQLNKMRAVEETKKKAARGGGDIPESMQ